MIKYIYQPNKKSKKHIWNEEKKDTYCKMWSTGGLKKNKDWTISDTVIGKETCSMCKAKIKKVHYGK